MDPMRLTEAHQTDARSESAEPALIKVYRETVRPLHRFIALRSGGSRELIEDVLQEAYLRAIEVWHAGHPPREPLPWLKTLARNLLINYYRKHRPQLVDPSLLSEARAVALIHWGLARLPDRHARLVEAFHLEGRSVREIATAGGLSERAVEGRLRRARKALEKRLEPLVRPAGDES
jgi:RNA polymerase sigma-70 factor (ECF subfamily)